MKSSTPSSIRSVTLRTCIASMVLVSQLGWVPAASARTFDFIENDQVDFDFHTRKGLRLRITEPDLAFRIGGRLHADVGFADADRTPIQKSDSGLRRARLYLDATLYDDLRLRVDRELAPDRTGWRNVWARYRLRRGLKVVAGNFVAPLGLEDMAASNYSTFLERSAASTLAPSFQTGLMLKSNGRLGKSKSRHRWTASTAFMTEPLGQSSDDRRRTEHFSSVSRLTYAPLAKRRRVFHLGAAVEYRDIQNDRRYRVSARPESSFAPTLLSTGSLRDVESVLTFGGELLALRGPWTFQSEYMRSILNRSNGRPDPSFEGGYAQISFVLTGEERRYSRSSGLLGGVRPRRSWGAVEIGLRFSALDLNDETVKGGSTRNWTIGANWYLRENVRFQANYVHVDARLRSTRDPDRPHLGQLRFQVFF